MAGDMHIFHCEELALNLTSFLSLHSCWCLSRVSQSFLSPSTAPRLHRALAWRHKLGNLFAVVELVLHLKAPSLPCLQELSSAIKTVTGEDFDDVHIQQLLALATGMLWISELSGGVLRFGRQADGGSSKFTFPVLLARWEQFDANLAVLTKELACDAVPRQELPIQRAPRRRRLSRQNCVTIPKGVPMHELGERTEAHQRAVEAKQECERWLTIVRGADSACSILEKLLTNSRSVCVDRVLQVLASRRSSLRQRNPLPSEDAPAALLLLLCRAMGGLGIEEAQNGKQQPRMRVQPIEGFSLVSFRPSLQKELAAVHRRHRQHCVRAKRAFIATLEGPTSSSEPESNSESAECKRPRTEGARSSD